MTRDELDTLWFQALRESTEAGEQYIRYHFAALVAAAERKACAKIVYGLCISDNNAQEIVTAIRARGAK